MVFVFHVHGITQNNEKECKREAQNTRITLKTIESLTYECSDSVLLKELNTNLKILMDQFRSKLPAEGGLIIRSAIQERVKRAEKLKSLPPYKQRGRKKMDSAYRNRVGRRADALRKVCHIIQNYATLIQLLYIIWRCTCTRK